MFNFVISEINYWFNPPSKQLQFATQFQLAGLSIAMEPRPANAPLPIDLDKLLVEICANSSGKTHKSMVAGKGFLEGAKQWHRFLNGKRNPKSAIRHPHGSSNNK